MKTNRKLLLLLLLFAAKQLIAQQNYKLVPAPSVIENSKGSSLLKWPLTVSTQPKLFLNELGWLVQSSLMLLKNNINVVAAQAQITLSKNEKLPINSYRIQIINNKIELSAANEQGMFYALQTLVQLINSTPNLEFKNGVIYDEPALKWRGMHLDVSRHFFTVSEVKKYLDYMALYKLNVFHWHLTDDQGWRIEIKRFPKLTEVGAWRNGSMVGRYSDHKFDSLKYGGYYTQNDIREVVAYAKKLHITVVPEIEMPGHALAALSGYPQYSCNGTQLQVSQMWGVFDDVFCAGNDSTFTFLQQILDEVISLFPSEYVHIGGDECPKTRWKTCPKCQARIKAEGLKDEHELQSYFIQRMEKYLNSKGKKIIGWDEILEGGLAPNAAVMSWRGLEGGIAAAQQQHFAVMTPGKPCYFDHYQNPETEKEPIAIGGLNTLKDVYNYQPIPNDIKSEYRKYILGAQANVWSEYMTSFSQVEYMALPRMAALAEAVWSKTPQKNYDDFVVRLTQQVTLLDQMKVNYCKLFLSKP